MESSKQSTRGYFGIDPVEGAFTQRTHYATRPRWFRRLAVRILLGWKWVDTP